MNIERIIGILGLLISLIGVFTTVEELNLSWAILAIGVILILYSAYIEIKPPKSVRYFSYTYDFTGDDQSITKGKKISIVKINKPNVTQLDAKGLTSTGDYKNFQSNIGRITVCPGDGGALQVICDLNKPLNKGTDISWVLSYDLVNSFNNKNEEVGVPCLTKARFGSIHLIFSEQKLPRNIRCVITKNGEDKKTSYIDVNDEKPELFWYFKVKFGFVFAIRWDW